MSYRTPRDPVELRSISRVLSESLGFADLDLDEWESRYDPGDFRAVDRNGEVAGGLVLLRLFQRVGGREVPMAGIHAVGVGVEHRGQGAASELMREAVRELRRDGTPISVLYPATQPVYRRVGYEHAGTWTVYQAPAQAIDARDRSLPLRRLEAAEAHAALAPIYERWVRGATGPLARTPWSWQKLLDPMKGRLSIYTAGDEGYLVFHERRQPPDHHLYDLRVKEMAATTPAAARRLWTALADHRSLADNVAWVGPPADPMQLWLREPLVSVERSMRWMLRVIDPRGALLARGYPPGIRTRLSFTIEDDLLEENCGRLELSVEGGEAAVTEGGDGALRADVRGLAALYTGYLSPHALAQSGLLDGPPEALDAAAALFAGPAPWLPEIF